MPIVTDWDKYPNFTRDEFVCRCGCDKVDMDTDFMEWLQFLRTELDHPMTISSGFRCSAHNQAVGGTENGPHTTGKAADIAIDGVWADALLELAIKHGARGKGIKQHGDGRFLHLDLLTRKATWSYG